MVNGENLIDIVAYRLEASYYENYYGKPNVWVGKIYIRGLEGRGEAHFTNGVHGFLLSDAECSYVTHRHIVYILRHYEKLYFIKLVNSRGDVRILLVDRKNLNSPNPSCVLASVYSDYRIVAYADKYDAERGAFVWKKLKQPRKWVS